ncbi:Cytidylate kinase [Phycisphaerae bacterium RAS1]|nr:Cytidylate kinase [Phycisphaerae bacterium RAS1]
MIITIDGPAGSGKSTAARKLAARLEIPYLDTGAMYRVVTLAALERRVDLTDEAELVKLAESDLYHLDLGSTHIRVTLRGHDVTEEIRSMRVSEHTRFIAASPGVRHVLIRRQREIGRRLGSMVTEGRDQGTAAFPDADVKFFVQADAQRRAERRYHELIAEGEDVTLEEVRRNVEERDRTDSNRSVAPLIRPPGAIEIDTSQMSIHDVVDCMFRHVEQARGARRGSPAPEFVQPEKHRA